MSNDRNIESCKAFQLATNHATKPRLLVSVRDSEEVLAALAGGADWIDLKEPNAGPLAAVKLQVAEEAVQTLAGRRTLSAALGELGDWSFSPARELLAVAGIDVVKLGLAGSARQSDWQQQWQAVAATARKHRKQLVAVIYADWPHAEAPSPREIISIARLVGCRYLLIDTYDKCKGSVFSHFSNRELGQILQRARRAGLMTVLAGSITTELIGQLPGDGIDMIAVRGAVCRGDRTSRVEASLIENFRKRLAARIADNQFPAHGIG